MSQHPLLTARLLESVSLSSQTKHLLFEVEPAPFDFIAGQFVSMKAMHDGREITRAYSIASAPRDQRTFDICLNRVPNGFFSNYLCDLEAGASVDFHGPHGYFVLRNPVRDSVFIATGTGIAPMRGMLDWLFAEPTRHEGREFWLVFGTRYAEDLYYDEQFREMERKHPNFHYVSTLSRDNEGWTGGRGYVQEHVAKIVGTRTDMDAYICGLRDMVQANRDMLNGLGWERKSILFERFD